jgi:hypothetical protein
MPASRKVFSGDERIQILLELGEPSIWIGQYEMEVVRQNAEGVKADPETANGRSEDKQKDRVGGL